MSIDDSLSLSEYIDHTQLRPDASQADIEKLCAEAREYRFKTVCLEAKWLPLAGKLLAGSPVLPITVIGFPSGSVPTAKKREETVTAIRDGAKEVDMVINRELLKARDYQAAFNDIAEVVKAAGNIPVKVILETSELTRDEKIIACAMSKAAGAAFVKTSTGFSKSGATAEDVALMREVVGPEMGVKASGGIRNRETALKMILAGASRLGVSASVAIVTSGAGGSGGY